MWHNQDKVDYLKDFIKKNGIDALFISSAPRVFYLTGFSSTNAYVIITSESKVFLTDPRYFERASEELVGWDLVEIKNSVIKEVIDLLKSREAKLVGYEKDRLTCEFLEALQKEKEIEFVGFSGILDDLRKFKDQVELGIIEEGIKITDEIYEAGVKYLKNSLSKGEILTELELRGYLVFQMLKKGASGESFPAIVACGKASSIPHWETSNQKIAPQAPLLIDMGLRWKGYCTDFTRTLYLGKPTQEFLKAYELVKSAWFIGFERVREGEPLKKVDEAIRKYFKKHGVDKYFVHATGHGIGVEIHEAPRVSLKTPEEELIKEGMVFTIEPGLYFKDAFGIRLENVVLVRGGRGEVVSEVPLDLEVIEV